MARYAVETGAVDLGEMVFGIALHMNSAELDVVLGKKLWVMGSNKEK